MTQCDRILDHLEKYGSITQLEAVEEFGCYRLSARIADLKTKGYRIVSDRETKKNRYGESVTFAKYKLMED